MNLVMRLIVVGIMILLAGCKDEEKEVLKKENAWLETQCYRLQSDLEKTQAEANKQVSWLKAIKDQWKSAAGWCTAFALLLFMVGCMVGSSSKRSQSRKLNHDESCQCGRSPKGTGDDGH